MDTEHGHEAGRPHAHGIGATLGRKVGPLPLYGWAALGGGALAILLYVRGRSGAATAATAAGDPAAGLTSTGDTTGAGSSTADGLAAQLNSLQQQSQQQISALTDQLGSFEGQAQQSLQAQQAATEQALQQQAAGVQQALQAQNQQQNAALSALGQGFEQSLAQQAEQMQQGFAVAQQQQQAASNSILAQFADQMGNLWATVRQVGGGTVNVPLGTAQEGSQQGAYVAGRAPATASNPAGGGTWNGLNDQQTQQLFEKTYGSNWQQVWQQQHAAAVARNGA